MAKKFQNLRKRMPVDAQKKAALKTKMLLKNVQHHNCKKSPIK